MQNMGNWGEIHMKNIDRWFILKAIVYAIMGMVLGLWMGINQDLSHTPLHAHLNLVGWASMAIFGLIHRAYPDVSASRLAKLHFVLMAIGTPVMLAGIPVAHSGGSELPVVAGSITVFAATIVFLVNFTGNSGKTA